MNKKQRKLINDTAYILKYIAESYVLPYNNGGGGRNTKVQYDFSNCKAYIFVQPINTKTGNGFERVYDWKFIDELANLSDKYSINYKIGLTDNLELHIQIYV